MTAHSLPLAHRFSPAPAGSPRTAPHRSASRTCRAALSWLFTLLFCVTLAACGGSADAPPPPEDTPTSPVPPPGPSDPPVPPVAPTITQQPADTTVAVGQPASFSVAATGTAPLSYQWQRNGADIAGATATTYSLPVVALADGGASFRAVVSNVAGQAISAAGLLSVSASAPVLTIAPQPADVAVVAGAMASFTVGGTCSSGTLATQWQRLSGSDFADLPGATAAVYAFSTVAADNGAQFRAVLSCDGQSAATSAVAMLSVTAPGQLTLTAFPLVGLRAQADTSDIFSDIAEVPTGGHVFITGNRVRRLSADGGTITLLAGSTTAGAVDGDAAAARFDAPMGLAVDPAGNVFVVDTGNQTVRRIAAADGAVTTVAGLAGVAGAADGSAGAARFNQPSGIAVGADGDLYVADRLNHRIRRVTVTGTVSTYAGSSAGLADGAAASAQFNQPYSVAVTANGDVLVSEVGNDRIRRILRSGSGAGTVETLAGNGVNNDDGVGTAAGLMQPRGMVVRGNVVTVRDSAGLVRQLDLTTRAVTTFTGSRASAPGGVSVGFADGPPGVARLRNARFGLATSPNGGFIVADDVALRTVSATGDVLTIASSKAIGMTPDGVGTLSQMPFGLVTNLPQSVAVDASGGLVIVDGTAQLVRRVSSAGVVTLAAGLTGSSDVGSFTEVDGRGSAAQFPFVGASIARDSSGAVFVGDYFGVRRIGSDNVTTTYAGARDEHGAVDGAAGVARFGQVWGVAVGAGGVVYASDYDNGAIRRIDTAGNVSTYAGVMGQQGVVDGPAASARFHHPGQMSFGPDGALYVVDGDAEDGSGGVLRRITPDGAGVSTVAGVTLAGGGTSASGGLRLTAAFAFDTDGTLYWGSPTGLMQQAPGGASRLLIPFGNPIVLGASPKIGQIDGMALLGARQLVLLSGGQILQATLP